MSFFSVKKQRKLNAELARKLLIYCPDRGSFHWRVSRRGGIKANDVAGFLSKSGYWALKINKVGYPAHRVAWLIQTGEWPRHEIDHRDQNRANNRWLNLREATHGQNQSNGKLYKNNRIGLKGVSTIPTRPGKFRARIRKDGREISLGVWNTPEEAALAYATAAKELHGEYRSVV